MTFIIEGETCQGPNTCQKNKSIRYKRVVDIELKRGGVTSPDSDKRVDILRGLWNKFHSCHQS